MKCVGFIKISEIITFRTPGGYHVGFTDDLHILIHHLNLRYPKKALFLTGFSLGGNVILKYLGEQEHHAFESLKIRGAAVTCVPFDPAACQRKLDVGISRVLYSKVRVDFKGAFNDCLFNVNICSWKW